jgi:hypothetical protein
VNTNKEILGGLAIVLKKILYFKPGCVRIFTIGRYNKRGVIWDVGIKIIWL